MAKCPQCKKNWKWDWEQDSYRCGRAFIKEIEFKFPEQDTEAIVYQCNCGKVLSVTVGGEIVNIPEWEKIDWETDPKSCWETDPKSCFDGP